MSKRKNALWNCKNPYQGRAPKILCVCAAGLLRSPTIAKELLLLGYNTRSCGCQDYALIPIDEVLIEWADVIVFADKEHKATVDQTQCLSGKEIYILDIPDNFGYNDPTLVQIIQDKLKERGFQKI